MKLIFAIVLFVTSITTTFAQIPSWFDIDNKDIRKNMSTVNDYGGDTAVGLFVVNRDTNGVSSLCLILGDSATFYRCTHISKDSTWTSTNVPNLDSGGYSPWDSLSGNVFLKDSTDNVGIGTNTPTAKLFVNGTFKVNSGEEQLMIDSISFGPFKLPFQGVFGKSSLGKTHQIGHFDLSQVLAGEVSNFSIRDDIIDQTGSGLGVRYGQTYLNSYDSTINVTVGTGKRYEYGHTTYGNGVGSGTDGHADIYCFDRDKNLDITALSAYHDIIAIHQYIDTTAGQLSAQALKLSLGGNLEVGMAYGNNAFNLDRIDFVVDTTGNLGIGTAAPNEKLHVEGTSLFTDSLTYQNGTQADGYVLTSDAAGNATWQDPTAYGEMGFGDSLSTITITQNVFSVVTNTAKNLWSTAAVDLHNVTYSGDSLIVDSAGTYQVNIQLSMDGTNGSVIRLGVFLNGVLACSCTGYQELSSNRIIQLNYINIDQLNANDVLQVVVTNTASNDDVDVVGGKITINKIR